MPEFEKSSVCVDCMLVICNGETSNEEFDPEEMDNRVLWTPGDPQNDEEFSSRSCRCCGSHLAGSRHEAFWSPRSEVKGE